MNDGIWYPHENMVRVLHLYNTKEPWYIYYLRCTALSIWEAKREWWKEGDQQKTTAWMRGFSEYQREMKSVTYLIMEFLWNYNLNHWTECCNSLYLWDQLHWSSSMLKTQLMCQNWPTTWTTLSADTHLDLPEEEAHCIARTVFVQCFWVATCIKFFWSLHSSQDGSVAVEEGDKTPNCTISSFSISFWAHCLPWGKSQSKSNTLCGRLLCTDLWVPSDTCQLNSPTQTCMHIWDTQHMSCPTQQIGWHPWCSKARENMFISHHLSEFRRLLPRKHSQRTSGALLVFIATSMPAFLQQQNSCWLQCCSIRGKVFFNTLWRSRHPHQVEYRRWCKDSWDKNIFSLRKWTCKKKELMVHLIKVYNVFDHIAVRNCLNYLSAFSTKCNTKPLKVTNPSGQRNTSYMGAL